MENEMDMKKVFLGLLVGLIGIGAIVYGGYYYSKNKSANPTTEIGENNPVTTENPPTAPVRFTAPADTPWISYTGLIYPYTFSYPGNLSLEIFSDPPDSVGISWGNLDPKLNILLDVQSIKKNSPQYAGQTLEYVRNWWKFYSGLKGISTVDRFVNANGLVGYKAIYINKNDQTPNVDVFFEIPKNPDLLVHLANGILDPEIFDRIVDSVKYSPAAVATATPIPPTPNP